MRLSLKESRMKFTGATKFNRKSGGAQYSKSHRAGNQGAVEKPNTVTLW
jgi:hypothetical protein